MGDAAFHNLLVENAAYIESLTSKQVVITDGNNIVAGMASGSDIAAATGNSTVGNVRIWAGTPTTSNDLTTAPFTVTNAGAVKATNIDLAGGSITGTLNIGANGQLHSSLTDDGATVQTTISATEIKNEFTDGSTYAYETSISEGKVMVYNNLAGIQLKSQLEPDDLEFYTSQNGVANMSKAVTTPIIIDNVMAGQTNWAFISSIVQTTALPQNPRQDTLYIIIPSNS